MESGAQGGVQARPRLGTGPPRSSALDGPREDVLRRVVVGVQLKPAGGATEGGLIRPAFPVDVAAG